MDHIPKMNRTRFVASKFFYNFHLLPFSVGRTWMIASPSEKEVPRLETLTVFEQTTKWIGSLPCGHFCFEECEAHSSLFHLAKPNEQLIDTKNSSKKWRTTTRITHTEISSLSRSVTSSSRPPVPEPGTKIVRASEEGGRAGRVGDVADGAVVPEGEQLLPGGVPRVPHAEGYRCLVGEEHEVFGVVEHGLGLVLLLAWEWEEHIMTNQKFVNFFKL